MLKIYLRLFFRNFKSHRGFALITTLGLIIGITSALFIGLWVHNELSYDRFHKNASDLYIVLETEQTPDGSNTISTTPAPLAEALTERYPDIVAAARVINVRKFLYRHEDKAFNEDDVIGVDPDFLRIFDFPLISGDINSVLQIPSSVVVTKSTAEKYFGGKEVIGQTLHIGDLADLTVTGIIEDPPLNSHLTFDMIVPINSRLITFERRLDEWNPADDFSTYILLQKESDPVALEGTITSLLSDYVDDCENTLSLLSLTKIHTTPEVAAPGSAVDMTYIYIFSGIAILILMIACLNFINLSIARALNRVKEIGIRKVVGGLRSQLIRQFMAESFFFAITAVVLAGVLIYMLVPMFEMMIGKPLATHPFATPWFYAGLIIVALATGLISGIYPALVLSAFNPVSMLREWQSTSRRSSRMRKSLVFFQFSISILLIIATLTVNRQIAFIQNKELGYDKDLLITMPLSLRDEKFEAFRTSLLENTAVENVTQAFCSPAEIMTAQAEVNWDGKSPDNKLRVGWCSVYYDYVETLGLELAEGRTFSRDHATDMGTWDRASFMVNEETVRQMGVESALGLNFELFGKRGPIIGVVKDFHFKTLHHKIEPLAFFVIPFFNQTMLVRMRPGDVRQTLQYIEQKQQAFLPGEPFEYEFVDAEFNRLYQTEQTMSELFLVFSLLAVFIACLGLFSLTSFAIERRTKEIGIRKVLGASIAGLVGMLSNELTRVVLLANLVAWPVAWYATNRWLQSFAYRIDPVETGWSFALAGILALAIAWLTVSWQAIRAATANPVEALRYE